MKRKEIIYFGFMAAVVIIAGCINQNSQNIVTNANGTQNTDTSTETPTTQHPDCPVGADFMPTVCFPNDKPPSNCPPHQIPLCDKCDWDRKWIEENCPYTRISE